jgi:cytochrome b involved in lipid metabolism
MPFENQSINESEISQQPKGNKLVVILITLIILSGGYLAYSFYASDSDSADPNTEVLGEINTDTNSSQTNNTEASSVSQDNSLVDSATDNADNKVYALSQVAENNNKSSCWTIIDNTVYDITSYVPNHPGGESEILKICGKDGTNLFAKPSEHKEGGADNVLSQFKIGNLSP